MSKPAHPISSLGPLKPGYPHQRSACILPGEYHSSMTSICKCAAQGARMFLGSETKIYSRNENQQDLDTSRPRELMLWAPSLPHISGAHTKRVHLVAPQGFSCAGGSLHPGPGPRVQQGVLNVSTVYEGTTPGHPQPCATGGQMQVWPALQQPRPGVGTLKFSVLLKLISQQQGDGGPPRVMGGWSRGPGSCLTARPDKHTRWQHVGPLTVPAPCQVLCPHVRALGWLSVGGAVPWCCTTRTLHPALGVRCCVTPFITSFHTQIAPQRPRRVRHWDLNPLKARFTPLCASALPRGTFLVKGLGQKREMLVNTGEKISKQNATGCLSISTRGETNKKNSLLPRTLLKQEQILAFQAPGNSVWGSQKMQGQQAGHQAAALHVDQKDRVTPT